jgi:hypothetical protein
MVYISIPVAIPVSVIRIDTGEDRYLMNLIGPHRGDDQPTAGELLPKLRLSDGALMGMRLATVLFYFYFRFSLYFFRIS